MEVLTAYLNPAEQVRHLRALLAEPINQPAAETPALFRRHDRHFAQLEDAGSYRDRRGGPHDDIAANGVEDFSARGEDAALGIVEVLPVQFLDLEVLLDPFEVESREGVAVARLLGNDSRVVSHARSSNL